jgi:hypothetical protein
MISKRKSVFLIFLFVIILVNLIFFKKQNSSSILISHKSENEKVIITNPYNYDLVLEPKKSMCAQYNQSEKLLLFVFIVSSPDAHNIRNIIRSTWYNATLANKNFKIIFSVGLSKDNRSNDILRIENQKYNDILQADLNDSYHVITIKNMLTFRWINNHCSNTHFILKVCDDVLVNINDLVVFLENNLNNMNTIYGYIWNKAYPKRDKQSIWYVSSNEFSGDYYDPFPSGTAFILTSDLSKSFYKYALGFPAPPFSVWMDDVYFGMIGARLKTKFVNIFQSYVPQDHYAILSAKKKIELIKENYVKRTLFVFAKEDEYKELWIFFEKYYKASSDG